MNLVVPIHFYQPYYAWARKSDDFGDDNVHIFHEPPRRAGMKSIPRELMIVMVCG